ncbi:hypothetical protein AGDE_00447 [Angomonas deanei]|nr:hypothetical protein AGDE_00447 [Angomonas deanei]|eukprot:EPY43474.1 hypothetical protein AGDE_00447 [Angomonas deanei]
MILGVGEGTFAVLLTIGVAILGALLGAYFMPKMSLFILLGCICLPLIVYGCILSSPKAPNPVPSLPPVVYREAVLPSNTDLIDKFLPVRIVIFLILVFSMFGGIATLLLDIMKEPPYTVPRMRCLREQLEEAHPTWYK